MKCKVCGHEANEHTEYYDERGCKYGNDDCLCRLSSIEIERDAWMDEALAARELLKLSKVHTQFFGAYCGYCERALEVGHLETCKYYKAEQAYKQARVKDEQP